MNPVLKEKALLQSFVIQLLAHTLSTALFAIMVPLSLIGGTFEKDFAVVFIDAASEAKFGPFPFDRELIAQAIDRVAMAKGRAVVLKFFYDKPKKEAGDQKLAKALSRIPVALQARLDDAEPDPNPLPERFTLPGVKAQTSVSGKSGWIPLPLFADKARKIGFVDFADGSVPILETYQDKTVKSLILCSLELAIGQPALVEPGLQVSIGKQVLQLDPRNEVAAALPKTNLLQYLPFHEVLDGTVPASALAGKVVIIGYDGKEIHSFETPIGQVKAHRMFVFKLKSIYENIRPASVQDQIEQKQ